ncbi:MAG TPA: hypothetical protein ENG48_07380 [Candidatus Atribacteria bacterium]|nr:hypothetical protein [Candidatus Atribacteria bacterium]
MNERIKEFLRLDWRKVLVLIMAFVAFFSVFLINFNTREKIFACKEYEAYVGKWEPYLKVLSCYDRNCKWLFTKNYSKVVAKFNISEEEVNKLKENYEEYCYSKYLKMLEKQHNIFACDKYFDAAYWYGLEGDVLICYDRNCRQIYGNTYHKAITEFNLSEEEVNKLKENYEEYCYSKCFSKINYSDIHNIITDLFLKLELFNNVTVCRNGVGSLYWWKYNGINYTLSVGSITRMSFKHPVWSIIIEPYTLEAVNVDEYRFLGCDRFTDGSSYRGYIVVDRYENKLLISVSSSPPYYKPPDGEASNEELTEIFNNLAKTFKTCQK